MIRRLLAALALLATLIPAMAQEAQEMISADEWRAYEERFVREDGRVVDDANGGISHSEGQGYGMLLAYMAGNRPAFERIWSFTRTQLLLRDDGLAVWKWDPAAPLKVADINNASDGDILIAYALALAGEEWGEPGFVESATRIADALGKTSIHRTAGMVLLRPGVAGFDAKDRKDGPVVNLSYWIFEALPKLAVLAPKYDWDGLAATGKSLLGRVTSGAVTMPPDWLSLSQAPKPAEGFEPDFGYNAMRIPLYLIRAGDDDMDLLERMQARMTASDGGLILSNVNNGNTVATLNDPGYRIIPALTGCVIDGTPVAADLLRFEPTVYYPSTLHLLALAHIREARRECG